MKRERALKIVLVLVGLLFCAAVYPLVLMAKQDPALAMMMSLYVTLGVLVLLASRNPSAHRSLIAFAAWSSFAHAALMAVQASLNLIPRRRTWGRGFLRCHWSSSDRAGSGKIYETANREGIGGCVGCSVALPTSYPAAASCLDSRLTRPAVDATLRPIALSHTLCEDNLADSGSPVSICARRRRKRRPALSSSPC